MRLNVIPALFLFMLCLPSSLFAALKADEESYSWKSGVFAVPLEVRDNSGVERIDWPVSSGVPLPFGIVDDPQQLRLTDAEGNEIPCQFTVLSRYWVRDNSIRWILLDFQISLPASGKKMVYLRNDRPAQTIARPVKITETDHLIKIDTGPLAATISRDNGHLLETVSIGGNPILKANPGDGAALRSGAVNLAERFQGRQWNNHGWQKTRSLEQVNIAEAIYSGGHSPPFEVTVETAGPMHSVVLIRGRHYPLEEKTGIRQDGFYNYATRLHFYRGKGFIKVEHSIENSERTQPQWNLPFHEASLNHSLVLDGPIRLTGGGHDPDSEMPDTASAPLPAGRSGWLYQTAGQMERKGGRRSVAHPGEYRVGLSEDGHIAEPSSQGRRGRFLAVSDDNKGVAIAMRYLWEQAPRAIALSTDRMRVIVQADNPEYRPLPDRPRPKYDLDFAERNIHDILYYFYQGDARTARLAEVAEAFEYPLFAYAPPPWYADTEAWYFEIAREPGRFSPRKVDPHTHWRTSNLGVRGHGYNRNYNSGGHHESLNSGWLPFLRTGALRELERNLVLSRWSIAHNPGWAYRDQVLQFGEAEDRYARVDRDLLAWNRLTGYGPKDFYLWRGEEPRLVKTRRGIVERRPGGNTYLNKYKWLPDQGHYALFRLFEYYYLTGDRRTLDAIHGFVNWGLNFQHQHIFKRKMLPLSVTNYFEKNPQALRRGHYSRVYAWMLYTNLAGLHATGNPVMDEFAHWQIRRLLTLLRHRHGQLTKWIVKDGSLNEDQVTDPSEKIWSSRAQTWMEGIGTLALHEAYKTYNDERILDALWAQADYFSHHVVYYPRLGMLNNHTSMPNRLLGTPNSLRPRRHGRHVQMWPILYHYTGWPQVWERYQRFEEMRQATFVQDWFLQTGHWERETAPKRTTRPPEPITDLKVVKADRSGITLTWTSPKAYGPEERAERYFVKYSEKPIVESAPTDNPIRKADKQRIIQEVEDGILAQYQGRKIAKKVFRIEPGQIQSEPEGTQRWHPDWHKVNAYWMAEHVAGEPEPGPPETRETFTMQELRPHNWFGASEQPGLEILAPGTYYIAICSWDSDRNLSPLSNVVEIELP